MLRFSITEGVPHVGGVPEQYNRLIGGSRLIHAGS